MDTEMELQEFEKRVEEIFYYCCRYGVLTFFKGEPPQDNFDGKELNRACFKGFKIAQQKIVADLKQLQPRIKKQTEDIKQARRDRNKLQEEKLIKEERLLVFQSDILRNLADSIAWQLLNGQHYFYRRLFTHEAGDKDLNDPSFDFVIQYAEAINENPDSMCLITDITNNIQLGDCLIADEEGIKVAEIKSGETNFKALEIIKNGGINDANYDETELRKTFDEKFVKQVKRMVNQQGKIDRAAKIIKDNEGPDPKFQEAIVRIIESDFQIEKYHPILIDLVKKLDEGDWAYDCIEATVHIGVYKNDWRHYGEVTLKSLCEPFPVIDLMAGRGVTICEPIFLKPLADQQILDIVFGRIKIYIGIDFEKLIEFANLMGIKASWSTPKELQKLFDNKSYSSKEIFSFKNKGIKIDVNGQEHFLGHGFFTKIIFDHFLPSTMILKYQRPLTGNMESNETVEEDPN